MFHLQIVALATMILANLTMVLSLKIKYKKIKPVKNKLKINKMYLQVKGI
jgi:hypothetical protein